MQFGLPGTINSSVSSQGVTVMATSQKKTTAADEYWNEIFDSLVIENEPPIEYIKRVIIVTKDGNQYKVSAQHFAKIIEHEKHLHPDESEIRSCKMSIDYNKLRYDVEHWAATLFSELDGIPVEPAPKATKVTKPRVAKPKPVTDVNPDADSKSSTTKQRRGKSDTQ